MRRRGVLSVGLGLVAATTAGCAGAPSGPGDNLALPDPHAAAVLQQLLDEADDAFLESNPLAALWRRDLSRAGRHGDYLSDEWVDGERRAAAQNLVRLAAIPRNRLGRVDRIAYDTFQWQEQQRREAHEPRHARVWLPLKLDHYGGWHLGFAELSSGAGVAPFRSVVDYEASLGRIEGFAAWLDGAVARAREGAAQGITQPRHAVVTLIGQFERLAAETFENSSYGAPFRRFPDLVVRGDRVRLADAFDRLLRERLQPALQRAARFLRDELLAAARPRDGISSVPGGAAWYAQRVRGHTTTTLSADAIHRLGLAEVERITDAMVGVMRALRFDGTLPQFFERLRADPAYVPASAGQVAESYRAIGHRVDAALPRLFGTLPRTPLELRPTPELQAPTAAAAHYVQGSPDGSEAGVFFFNTHDLVSRKRWGAETLYLHEAMPGHHLQVSLAVENAALPRMLRFGWSAAYGEGWALYAETLGPELGLFADPLQRFGHLNDEMLRAMRLVVDTGIHAQGWSREQAIDYMLGHSAMSRPEVVAEVERYIANPGQALAYKIGQLTIRRLRESAEKRLGARFDVRAFHREVLDTGAVPLAVLERKIADWLANAA